MSSQDRINPTSMEMDKYYPDIELGDGRIQVDRNLVQREERI